MFSVSVWFGTKDTALAFMFKNELPARQVYTKLLAPDGEILTEIADDFGQVASFNAEHIHAVLFEDMDLSSGAGIERGLHNARTQAKGNQLASMDPTLKAAGMLGGMQGNGMMRM